jgi:[protein-PII] uridylyltransferase
LSAGLPDEQWTVVALGSYARRQLCPGSDVDVMLLHNGGRHAAAPDTAGSLWYPLWDAGFVLGQSVRTVQEALAVADDDLDALTAMLEVRVVAGHHALADELVARVRQLAARRRDQLIGALADAAALRQLRPGPVAEMLQPHLKDGGGGLRDLHALDWLGWVLDPQPGGTATLVAQGLLHERDRSRLAAAHDVMLDARVALHRVNRGRSDQLLLQDQDAVAALVGAADADALVRGIGAAARAVVWITTDLWARVTDPTQARVTFPADEPVSAATVLHVAARAAGQRLPFSRDALERIATLRDPVWSEDARDAFVALLAAGRGAIPVFEALEHEGVLELLFPEWAQVRARPQRNAYHRFTVDRHSLEAVAEAAALLDPDDPAGEGFEGDVARRAPRDALLLSALLHDIAKGKAGDHSVLGVEVARSFVTRIGVDHATAEMVAWAVEHHLLLADTATRRDLSDEYTVAKYARVAGDVARNDLLYALTIADSRATGPAAWSMGKAVLVRELYVKADTLLAGGVLGSAVADERRAALEATLGPSVISFLDAMPPGYVTAFPVDQIVRHRELLLAVTDRATAGPQVLVEWETPDEGRLRCTVLAADRTGLLAIVAGTLALAGFDIASAIGYTHRDGIAFEVYTGVDRFGRLDGEAARAEFLRSLEAALQGDVDLHDALRDRARRYRARGGNGADRDVQVVLDTDASAFATVVEVHAPDDVGLLALVASVFVDLDVDVSQAIVQTTGDRVVDVFYVRSRDGSFESDRHGLDRLRATLVSRLTSQVTLDG